jgi:hypothetical protein
MYNKNPYYQEVLKNEELLIIARIILNNIVLTNKDIKSIKYDLNTNDGEKFTIGGVYGATVDITLLNFENELDNIKFENKEFKIELKLSVDDLYTVKKINKTSIKEINKLKIKHLTSLWIPQGIFYPTKINKNENETITIKLQDKTKYLEEEYECSLTPPFTIKDLYKDVHNYFKINSNSSSFYNEDVIINEVPKGYTGKEILGYIAECACGIYIINRSGRGEIRTFANEPVKKIEKGAYNKFVPAESYINIQKIKYNKDYVIGEDNGYILELSEKNPFITDEVAQKILIKMQGYTYITYEYKASIPDISMDVLDMIDITDTKNINYLTYIRGISWEYTGAVSQTWSAKGETKFDNTYKTKGPIQKQISDIVTKEIPNVYEEAVSKATELIKEFNGGYVIKKDGELYISDNLDIDKAEHLWRWNINGFAYSSKGINGPYETAITMNGQIVANFITAGTLSANRIKGGTLKVGGINGSNGKIEVLDSEGNAIVTIDETGILMGSNTQILGEDGLMNTYIYSGSGNVGFEYKFEEEDLEKKSIIIDIPIPKNLKIKQAKVILTHTPVYWTITDLETGEVKNSWGYARSVKLYKCSNINNRLLAANFGGDVWENVDNDDYEEINNAFGQNGFTAQVPSKESYSSEKIESLDISNELIEGINRLKIETSLENVNDRIDGATKTGAMYATIIIEGLIQY